MRHVDRRHCGTSNHFSTLLPLFQLLWTVKPMFSCTVWQVGHPKLSLQLQRKTKFSYYILCGARPWTNIAPKKYHYFAYCFVNCGNELSTDCRACTSACTVRT